MTRLRFLPFLIFGIIVFCLNSQIETNYFIRGYLTILEAQSGIILLYFLFARMNRSNQEKITGIFKQ